MYKSPVSFKTAAVMSSPSSSADDDFYCMPQDLILFMASIWLNKIILSKKFVAVKGFILWQTLKIRLRDLIWFTQSQAADQRQS